FWFIGLVPDFATLRDRSPSRPGRFIYGMLAMGWRGSARHWHRYETAYLLLAGLATPLVVSVHTVVSFDFAVAQLPGWHTTIFPPYFVAGAIYSGFAMVLTLAIPLRAVYQLEDFITTRHLQNMAKILLATGLIVAYGYMIEAFMAWYGGNRYEQYMIWNRLTGPYPPFCGLPAEFDGPCRLVAAGARVRDAGYRRIDTHTPFPLEELPEALGVKRTVLPLLVLLGGLLGCVGGYFMQYYASNVDYPLNVGGRPMHSWPMFVPITFELTVLLGGLTAVIGMLALNGLPMPYRPLFNVPR